MPSSLTFGSTYAIVYTLKASIQILNLAEPSDSTILIHKLPIHVVETWDDWDAPRMMDPVEERAEVRGRESGSVVAEARCERTLWLASQDEETEAVDVRVKVKNGTKRDVRGSCFLSHHARS